MRKYCLAMCSAVFASHAAADPLISLIEIDGLSRDRAKNELVLKLTTQGEFRLTQESEFRVIFEHDAEAADTKPLYQASAPVDRFTFTIAETGHGVQVATSADYVENGGSPFERRVPARGNADIQTAKDILLSIKSASATAIESASAVKFASPPPAGDQALPVSAPKPASHSRSAQPASLKTSTTHLGFSAELSENEGGGLVVTAVDPRTPAAKAGLQPSDIVTAIDGRPVTTGVQMAAAKAALLKRKRGALKVVRDGKTYDAMLKF